MSVATAVPTIEYVLVDRATAENWLEFNIGNRRLNDDRVKNLARDMLAGRWVSNGETIKFDREGRLIDGQHRLSAIVHSGVAIHALVVRGLEPQAQLTVDIGITRTLGQQLRILGLPNGNELAATAVVLWRYQNHPDKVWTVSNMPSKAEQIEFVQHHQDLLLACLHLANQSYSATSMRKSPYAAACAAAHLCDRALEFMHFHEGFVSGVNLIDGDPRIALRNSAIRAMRGGRSKSSTWDQQALMAVTLKAFGAYVTGKEVKLLRFTRDELPMPSVD